jgi:hypothetical protein
MSVELNTLPAGDRTPIHVTGSIDGDRVVATFVEDGRMRRTNGRVCADNPDCDQLFARLCDLTTFDTFQAAA